MRVASRAWREVRETASALADLVVPLECAGCGEPRVVVCRACRDELRPVGLDADAPALDGSFPVWGLGHYEGGLRHLVLGWKTGGRRDVELVLAPRLAEVGALVGGERGERIERNDGDVVDEERAPSARPIRRALLVVPVPSGPRRRLRGRPDVARLAAPVARGVSLAGRDALVVAALGQPLRRLLRPAAWRGQRGRGQRARIGADGTAGAGGRGGGRGGGPSVRARLDLAGHDVLLVDDVLTTGATLARCAEAVRAAGGVVVGGVVVAGARVRGRRRPLTVA